MVTILFLAVVAIGILLLVMMSLTRRTGRILDQEKYRSEWLSITQSITEQAATWQFAIIRADKLLDRAMKERGIAGETMGDRLKLSKSHFSNINHVWAVHKLRNKIAHESSFSVSKRQLNDALKTYKKALTELGAL